MEEQVARTSIASTAQRGGGGGFGMLIKLVFALALLVIIFGGGFYYFRNQRSGKVDTGKYQAVFLSNGQVYFGKISGLNTPYPTLTDIYYLIIRRPLQSQQPEGTETAVPQTPTYTLIKLGRELHGPVDKMIINRNHILFVEDLKEEGRVSQAIQQSKQQGDQPQPQPPVTQPEQPEEGE